MPTEFNTDQFSNAYADGIENSYWNIARNRIILKYLKRYKLVPMLDVGCGKGIVTSYLYKSGITITGVDLGNPAANKDAKPEIYYATNANSLPEALRKAITAISLFDVIEHIEKPVDFIKELSQNYPNLEYLVITVPARKELWSNFDDYYGHFRRYTPAILKKELHDSGFEPIFCRYFFHILYFLIFLNNKLLRKRKVDLDPPKGAITLFINKLMALVFYAEVFLIPGKLVGSSLICVCKKKN